MNDEKYKEIRDIYFREYWFSNPGAILSEKEAKELTEEQVLDLLIIEKELKKNGIYRNICVSVGSVEDKWNADLLEYFKNIAKKYKLLLY